MAKIRNNVRLAGNEFWNDPENETPGIISPSELHEVIGEYASDSAETFVEGTNYPTFPFQTSQYEMQLPDIAVEENSWCEVEAVFFLALEAAVSPGYLEVHIERSSGSEGGKGEPTPIAPEFESSWVEVSSDFRDDFASISSGPRARVPAISGRNYSIRVGLKASESPTGNIYNIKIDPKGAEATIQVLGYKVWKKDLR